MALSNVNLLYKQDGFILINGLSLSKDYKQAIDINGLILLHIYGLF